MRDPCWLGQVLSWIQIKGAEMQMIRRIGAVVLMVAAIAVWFGMNPANTDAASGYSDAISAALAADTANNVTTAGAAQQAVVNGWTARDLLTVIAKEGSAPVDQRPAALLTLLVIGFAIGLATTRPPVPGPAIFKPSAFEPPPAAPAAAATVPTEFGDHSRVGP
jgi:hypothetical protein